MAYHIRCLVECFNGPLSLLFGIGCVYLGWLIAYEIWGRRIAIKVGWTIALFPSVILYSVLILRGLYSIFFLLALYGIASWIKTNSIKSLIVSGIGFTGSVFHGGLLVGALIFMAIVLFTSLANFFKSFINLKINPKSFIISFVLLIVVQLYFTNNLRVPYLGTFKILLMQNIQNRTDVATRAPQLGLNGQPLILNQKYFTKGL